MSRTEAWQCLMSLVANHVGVRADGVCMLMTAVMIRRGELTRLRLMPRSEEEQNRSLAVPDGPRWTSRQCAKEE